MEQIEATVTASTVENANSLKRKSDDIGWEYGKLVDPNNKDRVVCNFCKNVNSGGINRFKKHIAQVGGGVAKCRSCPDEAKLACLKWLEGTEKKKQDKVVRELGLRSDVNVSSGGQQEEDLTCAGSSEPHKLGPIDKWARAIDPSLSSSAQFQQQKINQALFNERTLQVHQYIAKWVYTHAVAFNAIENDEFKQMVEAIGQFGPGLKPPTHSQNFKGNKDSLEKKMAKNCVNFYYNPG
ncbi:unnamed protein product [Linum trigynum]|uniref:BED-type domain-containing protein n=1 Tax=Linum trigynum TaxID=586398 RepID=A0AAV2EN69_9ROSI